MAGGAGTALPSATQQKLVKGLARCWQVNSKHGGRRRNLGKSALELVVRVVYVKGGIMAILDEEGDCIRCDRCGTITNYEGSGSEIKYNLWFFCIFKGKQKPDVLHKDFCKKCASEITPLVYRLQDIFDLFTHINKLGKEITNGKRIKNNRTIKNTSCECCKSSSTGGNGYSACRSLAQACEEHY